ncbi:cation transporter [Micromonospora sp. DT201]|uniref:cation transporter n=1 Tax=Micromonospora sp. DT201 TaxID=3393442 RepID=UPI003CF12048
MTESGGQSRSVRTVIVAGLVNIAVAMAKVIAGLLSGSAAVLAEAAHSFADTTTAAM